MPEPIRRVWAALRTAIRRTLHRLLKPAGVVVTLWPPFDVSDEEVYSGYEEDFDFYCAGISGYLCSYWRNGAGSIQAREHHSRHEAKATPPSGNLWSVVRGSSAVLLWRSKLAVQASRGFPNVYPMYITPRRYGYWLQIVASLAPPQEGVESTPLRVLRTSPPARPDSRIAVICSGPSSRFFLSDSVREQFDEVVIVNRVLYEEAYYHGARRVWLCAYDRLLFSPADSAVPPFLEALPLFLESPERYFVTMSYAERFLVTSQRDQVLGRTLFLSPRDDSGDWNLDLRHDMSTREASNVTLTLALPLAATLAQDIVIFGMDGAPLDQSQSWDHNEAFRYRPDQQLRHQLQAKALLKERREFYQNTQTLVDSLVHMGHRLYLIGPSLQYGISIRPNLAHIH